MGLICELVFFFGWDTGMGVQIFLTIDTDVVD